MVGTNDPILSRYNLPAVPLPNLGDDIANKAYVDAAIFNFGTIYGTGLGFINTTDSIRYLAIAFDDSPDTTELPVQMRVPVQGIFKLGRMYIDSNNNTVPSVVTFRKNGASTPLNFTVAIGVTGLVITNSEEVSVEAGDLVNWETSQAIVSTTLKTWLTVEFHKV